MTDDTDEVRAFTTALTPAARHHLTAMPGYDQIRCIHTACQRLTPKQLAKTVSAGIGYHTPANAAALLAFRLRREAGIDQEEEDG